MKTPQERIARVRASDRRRVERITENAHHEQPMTTASLPLPSVIPRVCDECGGRIMRAIRGVGDSSDEAVCESCGLTFGWF